MPGQDTCGELKKRVQELEQRIQELESENIKLQKAGAGGPDSLKELAELFSLSSDLICVADINTASFLRVNPSFTEVLGYTEKDLLGRSFLDFIHPEDVAPTIDVTQKKLQSGEKIINFENRYRCSDGRYRWLEWTLHPVPERGGATYAIGHDITDRKKTEAALQDSEAFVRLVLDNLPIGIAVNYAEPPVVFEYMNDAFPQYYRTTRGAIAYPDDFWEAVYESPEFREEIRQRVLDDLASGDSSRMIWKDIPITREGEETTYITARDILIPQKELLISTVWDVTERKKAEDALRETKRFLEETQKIAKLGGWSRDLATGRSIWTEEVYRLHGIEPGEPLDAEPSMAFYVPAHRPLVAEAYQNAIEMGVPYDLEVQLKRRDGVTIWVRTTGEPVQKDGKIVRITGFIMDITDRKEAEDTLRETKRLLEETQAIAKLGGWEYIVATEQVLWTEAVFQIYDIDPTGSSITHQKGLNGFIPEHRVIIATAAQAAIEQGVPYDLELQLEPVNDTSKWVRVIGQPFLKDGKVERVTGFVMDITDRKEAEDALRETKRFLEETQKIAKLGGWSYDVASGRIIWTDEMYRIHGVEPESEPFEIQHGLDSVVLAYRSVIDKAFKKAIEDGIPYDLELQLKRKDGATIWVRATGQPVEENGRVVRVTGYLMDITTRKAAELALQETQQLLEETQAIAKLGGWSFDVAMGRIVWTDEMYRIHGLEPGSGPLDIHHALACYVPAHRPVIEKALQRAVENGVPYDLELQFARKDGATIWVRAMAHPFVKDGTVVRVSGYLVDITERKQAEEALRQYERIVSTSRDFIHLVNTDYVYEAVNESFLNHINKSREEVVGHTVGTVLGEGFFQETLKLRLDEAFTGKIVQHQFDVVVDEDNRIMEATLFPMMEDNGIIKGAVVNVRDITKTRKLEEQLMQAQKIESIGRLAGGVAHDLNNLLTPILAYGEMLSDEFSDDDARKHRTDQIVQAGLRARDLVQQLLAFSRKQTLEYKLVDMNNVVANFEKLVRRTIREDVDIKIILAPGISTVMADVGQIGQVIMNLAVNAADAMPDGGRLTIETALAELDREYADTHQGVRAGQYVMMSVSDTGCGMDSETQKHLFEPFFSTKGEQGTGLGLATVYGIVKQHKGNIYVYSEPEKGTTFKIYLPVCEAIQAPEKSDETTQPRQVGSETVLIAEDNEIVRELGETILTQQGYTVLVAENGTEALELMASHGSPIDLLLTDLIMPGMNGKELYERAAEKQPGLKVLYMSGYTDNVVVHHGVLDEDVQLLQKPFTVQGLVDKVQEALAKS